MPLDVAVDEACAIERIFAELQAEPTAAASRDASASVWPLGRAQERPVIADSDEACAIERVFAAVQAKPTAAAFLEASATEPPLARAQEKPLDAASDEV
jgi:hypothetical protein